MKKTTLLFIIILLFLLLSCKKDITQVEDEILKETEKISAEYTSNDKKKIQKGIPSPLSGIYAPEKKVKRRPVAVMFDNHPNARWQSGLSQAEIVYEFLVEAPYTRYMGIFLINDPEAIGPIRSSRPYFITALLEYDPIYVRVGGSPQAKQDIIKLNIADIDGLSSSNEVFWENKKVKKRSPHNTYTSMKVIREVQGLKGYDLIGHYEGFKFNDEDVELEGFVANSIDIHYYNNNVTSYIYNSNEKLYYRKKDGVEHHDELDNTPIKTKNIIIQEAKTSVIDKEGRLSIDLIGEGKGKYITNGKGIDIKWSKESRNSKTYYYDKNGEEIVLNPGITWIQVVNTNTIIDIY
ncbi:DUF3048 family protein [Keratinibaculum paraultunense]|uniref:DUF3048 family protein n=1 Tax=Keratinibaculum paraultunense TaxID=1278232 RepID=A0A4R3KYT9_9FIRM|nr:DUF3048 domain-containing protein [Keratinibaculum paraultunense]QQY80478.1 DUF3048 domain-containing protein [Keratinibaculum paraultunense]TCS91196.1 DUF3048 family protein [Keratinibaculum paraultunense]